MGELQIIDKLGLELQEHSIEGYIPTEKDVVYIFVELRKLLKQKNLDTQYPMLKFYADWVVHHRKDHIPEDIKKIVSGGGDIQKFAQMEDLRNELIKFTSDFGFTTLFDVDTYWSEFHKSIICVLSEQPLVINADDVRFEFKATKNRNIITYDEYA